MFARTLRTSLASSSRQFSSSPRMLQVFSEATEDVFNKEVLSRSDGKVVVVDFFAPWCGPCKVLKPILTKVSAAQGVDLVTVDIDEQTALGEKYQIRNLPTVYAFKNGEVVNKFMGMKPQKAVEEWIASAKWEQ